MSGRHPMVIYQGTEIGMSQPQSFASFGSYADLMCRTCLPWRALPSVEEGSGAKSEILLQNEERKEDKAASKITRSKKKVFTAKAADETYSAKMSPVPMCGFSAMSDSVFDAVRLFVRAKVEGV